MSIIIGFSDDTVKWFQSFLSNRKFSVNLENSFSEISSIIYGVPQGYLHGPLLFFIYVIDMPLAVKCNLFLYVNDSWLVFQSDNVKGIEKQLNQYFANICDWFADNKLSIHLRENKTKSILFTSKQRIKHVPKVDIIYKKIQIKQNSRVTYLACIYHETMPGESVAHAVITRCNARLNFLHRKN